MNLQATAASNGGRQTTQQMTQDFIDMLRLQQQNMAWLQRENRSLQQQQQQFGSSARRDVAIEQAQVRTQNANQFNVNSRADV